MAIVAAYNFDALLTNGSIPDMAGYSRDLTPDPGVALTTGHTGKGLSCSVGGAAAAWVSEDDYISEGSPWSCFAWVRSLDATPGERVIAQARYTSGYAKSLLLSDASGFLAAKTVGGGVISSGVSVLDGAWHHVGVVVDAPATNTITFWVDGVSVASVPASIAETVGAGVFSIGRGTTASDRPARAVIDDVRWFNDAVAADEVSLFTSPVVNLVVAAYNMDGGAGLLLADQTLRHNSLNLTGSGSWIPGVDGTALGSAGGHGAEATGLNLWTDGAFDRLSVCGWVKVTTTGSAAPFVSLEAADGSPRLQIFRGSAGALLYKAWGNAAEYPQLDGAYHFIDDNILVSTEWRFFFVNLNPTGAWLYVLDAAGTILGSTHVDSGGHAPTNHPILSGITTLRLGGGVVALDDVRVIRNYLNSYALTKLATQHVIQEPSGIQSDAYLSELAIAGCSLGATSVDAMYVGSTKIYGA